MKKKIEKNIQYKTNYNTYKSIIKTKKGKGEREVEQCMEINQSD